ESEEFKSINTEEYSWTFENNVPTTVEGDIALTPASQSNSGFAGKTALELSRDLMLDSDGYWSIEWKSNGVGTGSMLLSSADEYSKSGNATMQPNFIFIYHTNDTGWRMFRDTAYTDHFWRGYTGNAIAGEHVFKMECRNNVYTFSIDGEVMDSRKIVEGHGSYKSDKTYSGAGYFDNVFNVHYLLGGINQNGIGSTKYGYNGDVSYVTIKIGEKNPAITNINNYPYSAKSGSGTAKDPYIIDVNVAAGTEITDAAFTANVAAGTMQLSADKFGGDALQTLTCDAGTKSVYAMLLGSLPHMSTFYKVNFVVSATPDKLPDDIYPDASTVMVDAAADTLSTGDAKKITVDGKEYSFVKGYNLYDSMAAAMKAVPANGTILMAAGVYDEKVDLNKSVTIKGAQAGINPNATTADEKVWTAVRSDLSKETVITGLWTVQNGCEKLTIDGVALNKTGRIFNGINADGSAIDVAVLNVLVDAVSNDQALRFGDTSTSNVVALTGSLLVENMRAVNLTKNSLMTIVLNEVTIKNSYFDDGSRVAKFLLPDVVDGATDHTAAITFTGNLLDGAAKANALDIAFDDSNSKSAANYGDVAVTVSNNVFVNTICAAVTNLDGVINFSNDQNNFTFALEDNLIYEGAASASAKDKAFLVLGSSVALTDGDRGDNYTVKKNRMISESADVAMLISADSESRKNHNNINVGGNYAEVNGAYIVPNTNTNATAYTQNNPISFLNYYYTKADLSESTCDHVQTETKGEPASCQNAGYEILICVSCGEELQRTDLPKTDHIISDWMVETEATCTAKGSEIKICTFCGETMEQRDLDALGHDEGQWTNILDPTCSAEGQRAKLCGRCGEILESIVLDKKDHAFEIINTVEADCTAAGYNELQCAVCGELKEEPIAQKLHTPGKWTVVSEPTCYASGLEQIVCTECGIEMESRTLEPAHVGEWIDILPSEGGSIGIKAFVCTVCGELIDDQIELVVTQNVAVQKFEDVGLNDWFVKNGAVDVVTWFGLFSGTSETTFSPQMNMTRAMFVTVLGRLEGVEVDHNVTTRFDDVAKGTWYTGYVAWAVDAGIVHGMDYYTFAPNAPITREQICKMIIAYCDSAMIQLDEVAEEKEFADEKAISAWAKPYVKACQKAGLISGKEGNRFDPKGNATRAEVATIMTQLLTNIGVIEDLISLL
ncbi:MAG: S-layer homology domain-containing protein, partial [Clostridia bacterium]|nr:S-layer homology domain-containing protein [Clostridia bacterium]